MIPDISAMLSWLENNSKVLYGIRRGIEREGLRINTNGGLACSPHPEKLGSALTHKWITTDFAEALLEFITPVDNRINHMLTTLRDIHRYVIRHLDNELLWPMSMPCFIENIKSIAIAKYGCSNIGQMKTLYRKGLKNRYGALMQLIAGVHYNFSLPLTFWQAYSGIHDEISGKEQISAGYLQLIRNYYRFGWIIPYLFGASPGVCPSFLNGRECDLPFQQAPSGFIYLPYATSLRLSDLGYTNRSQNHLDITFNNLDEYIFSLKQAMKTPYADYKRIGLQKDGNYLQLSTSILQIENELYAQILPKRIRKDKQSLLDALIYGGIEYVEVRSLDVNPFSPIGINEDQIRFLDIFLIWCTLAEVPKMSAEELRYTRFNWNSVILEGRKPDLMLTIDYDSAKYPIKAFGKLLFQDFRRIAEILDKNNNSIDYQQVCNKLITYFDYQEFTISARLLKQLIDYGIGNFGLTLAKNYFYQLSNETLQVINAAQLDKECIESLNKQRDLEAIDFLNFDEFLAKQYKH